MLSSKILIAAGAGKPQSGSYYPRPSLSGPERCIRQMTYWASGRDPDKQSGDRFILILDDSKWHEELTGDWLRKIYTLHSEQMGIDIFTLPFLSPEPRWCNVCKKSIPGNILHGHIDGILQDKETNEELMYEHKAINHFTFNRYWNGTLPIDYLTQSCLYFKGLKALIPNMKKGVLLIKNKNTSQYIDYMFTYDEERDICTITEIEHSNGDPIKTDQIIIEHILSDVADKFYGVYQHVQDKTLPERPYLPGTEFPCGYCNWEPSCWDGFEGEMGSDAVILPNEYIPKASQYRLITEMINGLKKEKDEIREDFILALTELKTTVGNAADFKAIMTIKKKEDGLPSITFTIRKIKREKK